MGLFHKLALFLGIKKREVNVLVIGLNNSGKSTVINHFKNEEDKIAEIVPTVGFSVERFQSKNEYDFIPSRFMCLSTSRYITNVCTYVSITVVAMPFIK